MAKSCLCPPYEGDGDPGTNPACPDHGDPKPYFTIDGHILGDGTVIHKEMRDPSDPIFASLELSGGTSLHYSIVNMCPRCEVDDEDCECPPEVNGPKHD